MQQSYRQRETDTVIRNDRPVFAIYVEFGRLNIIKKLSHAESFEKRQTCNHHKLENRTEIWNFCIYMILFPIIQDRFQINSIIRRSLTKTKNRTIYSWFMNHKLMNHKLLIINQTLLGAVKNETRKIVIVVAGLFLNQFLIKEFHLKHLIYQRHLH